MEKVDIVMTRRLPSQAENSPFPIPRSSAILAALRRHGFESWALTPRADAVDVEEALAASAPDRRLALWLGKEGPGLTTEAIEACDRAVRINMSAGPDALNVTSASAVALYVSVR